MINGTSEGGIFSGKSVLGTMLAQFLVQAIIVIFLSRLFDSVLRFMRQPRVIAEVISGICLGPSVFGRIPGFTDTIFPSKSIDAMKLVANIGLVLYMFLVGLELDPRSFFANMKKTALISLAGMVIPFGLGVALSWGLYTQLLESDAVPFSSFLLFTGVAMSITAFPVLARILSERRLFGTTVGSMTISAAAFDDATAWCLLALVLSIINANSPITALWVFLTMLLYVIILLALMRFLLSTFVRLTMRSRRFATATIGQTFLAFTFIFIFISAWITEFIGVHAIFGAFLVGVIMPRGTGIVVSLTEKIEDLVSIVLLPLYFASSGLKTKISVLNDGITWAWLVAVIVVACFGKICGCLFAARLSKLTWRESLSVGILMNTKGLVELIVLNIGLDAGVINDRIFAVMVIMCLVTTFMTSPLISFVYPKSHQVSVEDDLRARAKKAIGKDDMEAREEHWLSDNFNVLACIDRMEQVPSIVSLASKFQVQHHGQHDHSPKGTPFIFNVLRLMEATDRSSSLFYASSTPGISPAQNDPVLQMMSLFTRLMNITTKCFYAVAPVDAYNEEVERVAGPEQCNALLMSVNVDGGDQMVEAILKNNTAGIVPILYVDRKRVTETQVVAYSPAALNNQMNDAFTSTPMTASGSGIMTVLVPFEGGRMDRKAVKVALRMSMNHRVHLTVLHVVLVDKSHSGTISHPDHDPGVRRYGAVSFISSKLHPDGKIDYDAELLAEVKRESTDRPQSVTMKTVTTTSLIECVVGECKEHPFDLVVLSHVLDPLQASVDRRQKQSGVNEFTGSFESPGTVSSPPRKLSGEFTSRGPRRESSIRESLRKRSRHGWVWPSMKENILGLLGHRLLQTTEIPLLVVGQSGPDDEIVTHI